MVAEDVLGVTERCRVGGLSPARKATRKPGELFDALGNLVPQLPAKPARIGYSKSMETKR